MSGSSEDEQGKPLEHSDQYQRALALRKRKHDHRDGEDRMEVDGNISTVSKVKQPKFAEPTFGTQVTRAASEKAMSKLAEQIKESTDNEYKAQYGDEWRQALLADLKWGEERRRREHQQDRAAEQKRRTFRNAHLGNLNGQYALNAQGYITGWQKNFFTGTYLDDHDSRLP